MKIKINHDVFNIVNRLKQINKNYFVMYNKKTNKFEIHNKSYANTLCLTLPYSSLDARAINYVLKSEQVEQVLLEIERNNQNLKMQQKNNLTDKINYQLNEIYSYALKGSGEFNGNAYKTLWV